ncbi:hypothetical protein GCM10009716_10120 [Streptomyces sodiiphilus]|uniref:Uncharacterized protein n=1 Tax=Streptomyces sodiiphilus TaxID=226217 RepID=A0ABN2NU66_9ACTN
MDTPHWHGYSYLRHEHPPAYTYRTLLAQSAREIKTTVTTPEDGLTWLAQRLEEHPMREGDMPADTKLEWAEVSLRTPSDVVWGYPTGGRYAEQLLLLCQGTGCPAPPAR